MSSLKMDVEGILSLAMAGYTIVQRSAVPPFHSLISGEAFLINKNRLEYWRYHKYLLNNTIASLSKHDLLKELAETRLSILNGVRDRANRSQIAIAAPVRQAHIANGFPPENISIIHNPSISSCTSDNSDKREQSVCRISYFGTIGNLKGPDRLIEFADVLRKREFPFDMRIYGAPTRRRSFTKKLIVTNTIKIVGFNAFRFNMLSPFIL